MFITQDDGHGHVWNGIDWDDVGQIQGPKGDTGDAGADGDAAPDVLIQYSIDGNAPWTSGFISLSHKYIRFSTDGGESWSVSAKFVGQDGQDGAGATNDFIVFDRIGNVNASQGVASDGEFFYTTGFNHNDTLHLCISKFTHDGTLIQRKVVDVGASTGQSGADGSYCKQLNGIYVQFDSLNFDESRLYISAMNYNVSPKISYIKVFKTGDLSFIEEHQIGSGTGGATGRWSESICYRKSDQSWWMTWDDYKYVTKYNSSWVWQADYVLSYPVNGHFYQSALWVGDYLYCVTHESSVPEICDVYKWNGAGFDEIARLTPPSPGATNQGIAKEPYIDILWWAERDTYYFTEGNLYLNDRKMGVVKTNIPIK